MPKIYEAIRDKFKAQGMPLAEAKTHAAKIYNAQHPKAPVGPYSDEKSIHVKRLAHALRKS